MINQRRVGAILGYANVLVKNIVYLLYTPLLLAFMGQGDYGVYETCYSFVYSLQLLSFGFSGAYVRFYMLRSTTGDKDGIKRLNGMYFILYLAISFIAVLLGLGFSLFSNRIFAASFTTDEISLASKLMSIMTFNIATVLFTTVFDSFIIAHEKFTFQQSRQLITTIATPGLTLLLLRLNMGAVGAALAQLSVNVILLILNAQYAISKLGWRCDIKEFEVPLFKSLVAFSGWLFLNEIFNLLTLNAPSVVLGAVSGSVAVSVFAIAVKLRGAFYSISTTMSNLFIPLVNRVVAETDNNEELTRILARVGRYQAILYCWVLGAFIVVGNWFIGAWAGAAYHEAYYMTVAMLVPATVPLVQNVGIEIQKAKNMHKARSLAYLICSVIDLTLTVALARRIGAWAAVVGYVFYIVAAAWLFMNWYYEARIGLNMTFYWKRVMPVIVCSVLATILCFIGTIHLPVNGFATFLLWSGLYTITYAFFVWKFSLNERERYMIIGKLINLRK